MLKNVFGLAVVIASAYAPALAQTPGPVVVTAPVEQTPAPVPAPAGGGQKVGQTGNPDPGVNFLNVVENAQVRVLQVTLQPGAVRRPHLHTDVTFHILVPVTGSLELTIEKDPVITTVPGQAYYMMKGQTHSLMNKGAAAVQVIEVFVKPDPATLPAMAGTTDPATAPAATPVP